MLQLVTPSRIEGCGNALLGWSRAGGATPRRFCPLALTLSTGSCRRRRAGAGCLA